MEKTIPLFSLKNIPIPSKYEYEKKLVQKAESFLDRGQNVTYKIPCIFGNIKVFSKWFLCNEPSPTCSCLFYHIIL